MARVTFRRTPPFLRDRLLALAGSAALGWMLHNLVRSSRAEQELAKSEELHRITLSNISDAVFMTDDNGRLTYVCPNVHNIFGYSVEEVQRLGRIDRLLGPDLFDPDALDRAGEIQNIECKISDKFGRHYDLLINVKRVHIDGGTVLYTCRDISTRKQAAEALKRYAERLEALQEIDRAILAARSPQEIAHAAMRHIRRLAPCQRASVVLFDLDKRQARVMAMDGNWDLGPRVDTVMPMEEFNPVELLSQGPVRYIRDIAELKNRPAIYERLLADGIRSFITVPLLDEEGLFGEFNLASTQPAAFPAEYQAIAREVAHPLAVAIQQARLRERATQAEVLRQVDELRVALLDSVSHNLRTPLAIIKAAAGSLMQEDVVWECSAQREFAGSIDREVDRLNRLVSNLLDMSRIEAGVISPEKEPYPIREVVLAVTQRLAPLAANHQIQIDVPDDLPPVPLDYVQIDQVLSNLLENAINYTPGGTLIRISAQVHEMELWVRVCDRGPGIPREDRIRVFEKFQRLSGGTMPKGSGLGLSVSKGLIEAHGGRIWIDETSGGGATVSFSLPLDSSKPHSMQGRSPINGSAS